MRFYTLNVFVFLLALSIVAMPARAVDTVETTTIEAGAKNKKESPHYFLGVLEFEGSAVILSKIAAAHPRAYGNAFILSSPFVAALAGTNSRTQFFSTVAVLAGIGAYNRSLAERSKSTIFRNNMILFNTLLVSGISYALIKNHSDVNEGSEVVVTPTADGAMIFLARTF